MTKVKLWTAVVAVLLAGIVIVQNAQIVSLRLLFWQVEVSQLLLLIVVLLLGVVIGFLAAARTGSGAEKRDR